jgi:hypothetical protein
MCTRNRVHTKKHIKNLYCFFLLSSTRFDLHFDHYQADKTQVQKSAAPLFCLLDAGQYVWPKHVVKKKNLWSLCGVFLWTVLLVTDDVVHIIISYNRCEGRQF